MCIYVSLLKEIIKILCLHFFKHLLNLFLTSLSLDNKKEKLTYLSPQKIHINNFDNEYSKANQIDEWETLKSMYCGGN